MKKYSLLWLILILLFNINISHSQSHIGDKTSIIHFKDGSIYLGEILNTTHDDVTLLLSSGNEIKFSKRLVTHYFDHEDIDVFDRGKWHIQRGLYFEAGLGINAETMAQREGETPLVSSLFSFMMGYTLNERVSLAAGMGFEFNEAEISGFRIDTQFIPIYLRAKYFLTNQKEKPFLYIRPGYGYAIVEEAANSGINNGGPQLQLGAGIQFASKKQSKFIFSLGYHIQKTDGNESFVDNFGSEVAVDYDILIKRIVMTMSYEFSSNKTSFKYKL